MLKKEDINNYGIVYTPEILVNKILNLIPQSFFSDKNMRWLDIGAGCGAFSINLYNRLLNDLSNNFNNIEETKNHIIKNMIFMVEIYPEHIKILEDTFGKEANIINKDFLTINKYEYDNFDFIIGNPPFNIHGSIKTPTNNNQKKTDDGKAIYVDFIKKSLDLLHEGGYLNLIIPSLWLKPDKSGLYNILTNLKIHKLICLSGSETQKEFNYKAQTPTCYFLIENIENIENKNAILIYDKLENNYINYKLNNNFPIPTHGINIINKLLFYVNKYNYLQVNKTSTISKTAKISNIKDESFNYINIKTCILEDKLYPKLIYNYSNNELSFYKIPKLILSHKMYGFSYFDISGNYGISTRDNYIISNKKYNINELTQIHNFLSTKFALFIFSTTNYRMRLLEKYAFEFIPDITKINNFPNLINLDRENRDKKINDFFKFSQKEISYIEKYSKNYIFFT
jgi:hypothetical protein